jgi:CBS domain-containing protein
MSSLPTTVAELMTRKVITCSENDTLAKLEEGMLKFRVRHLPVVDGDRLIGLVSHRDLARATPSSLIGDARNANADVGQRRAREIMRTELVTVRPDEPLRRAAQQMWEAKIGCLPVTDDDHKLLGILTQADFLKLAIRMLDTRSPAARLFAPLA